MRCVPFWMGGSQRWFFSLMASFARELRSWGYRILPYSDEFLIAPAPHGVTSTSSDCAAASIRIDRLPTKLGLSRQRDKGFWVSGVQRLQHLGMVIDTRPMTLEVSTRKVEQVRDLSMKLQKQRMVRRRYVNAKLVQRFCGLCISLTMDTHR